MQHLEVAFILIVVALVRKHGPDLLGRQPIHLLQKLVVDFGTAVGEAGTLPLLVYLTNWSRVSVATCADADAQAVSRRAAAMFLFMRNTLSHSAFNSYGLSTDR